MNRHFLNTYHLHLLQPLNCLIGFWLLIFIWSIVEILDHWESERVVNWKGLKLLIPNTAFLCLNLLYRNEWNVEAYLKLIFLLCIKSRFDKILYTKFSKFLQQEASNWPFHGRIWTKYVVLNYQVDFTCSKEGVASFLSGFTFPFSIWLLGLLEKPITFRQLTK